ncbi:hypothetical protein TCAL_04969 [Tigriopus californicus]|uniref:Uncharacterized protein n=1 Tax=Tigriopus californicus TaxID=6832 RepID=A0A553PBB2_TIGCA|nr:hypothetical protein TCAL_04969 [Tigriopus californicus]|eukprot:TCALIF_04969-PA protein Name:"Protein of unknown function" AED:0.10 eAED:0.19 QI:145/0/0.66/1/0/0/3/759/68
MSRRSRARPPQAGSSSSPANPFQQSHFNLEHYHPSPTFSSSLRPTINEGIRVVFCHVVVYLISRLFTQ